MVQGHKPMGQVTLAMFIFHIQSISTAPAHCEFVTSTNANATVSISCPTWCCRSVSGSIFKHTNTSRTLMCSSEQKVSISGSNYFLQLCHCWHWHIANEIIGLSLTEESQESNASGKQQRGKHCDWGGRMWGFEPAGTDLRPCTNPPIFKKVPFGWNASWTHGFIPQTDSRAVTRLYESSSTPCWPITHITPLISLWNTTSLKMGVFPRWQKNIENI